MLDNKKIGIVVLNYNDSETTIKLCKLIHAYEVLDYIVVVDNQSTGDSYEQLKKISSERIQVIQTDANKGYSYGNNFGINYLLKNYDVDIVFISNPDVEFSEQFIIQVVKDMGKYNAQAATGFMKTLDNFCMNQHINTYWREVINCTFLLSKIFPLKDNLVIKNSGIIEVEWVPGSLFAIDIDAYQKTHGFDESFFLYYEEQILGKKFHKMGYKMIVDTDIEYLHNESVSINKSLTNLSKAKQLYKSKYNFFSKYENIGILKKFILKSVITYSLVRKFIRQYL